MFGILCCRSILSEWFPIST